MKKHVLVTGGAGFIGSHAMVALWEAGYVPVCIDNLANSRAFVLDQVENIIGEKIPFYPIDCRNFNELEKVFQTHPISGIIHFAADKAVGESVENPLQYYDNNIASLIAILRMMEKYKVKHFVFSSSCTVYAQPDELPVSENAAVKTAQSPYGNTKQIGEEIIHDFIGTFTEGKSILLRYFNPIGAHKSGLIGELPLGKPNNLIPFLTQSVAGIRGELTVFGSNYNTPDGTCIRDYIHVMDLANAHVKALEYMEQMPAGVEIYNVGTGKGNTVLEVIQTFETAVGKKVSYKMGKRRDGDVEQVWANATKIGKNLGWSAKYTLADALQHAWKWQCYVNENLNM